MLAANQGLCSKNSEETRGKDQWKGKFLTTLSISCFFLFQFSLAIWTLLVDLFSYSGLLFELFNYIGKM